MLMLWASPGSDRLRLAGDSLSIVFTYLTDKLGLPILTPIQAPTAALPPAPISTVAET